MISITSITSMIYFIAGSIFVFYNNLIFIVISNTAFVCMSLMYNFSKFADMAGNISKMAGVTHRY